MHHKIRLLRRRREKVESKSEFQGKNESPGSEKKRACGKTNVFTALYFSEEKKKGEKVCVSSRDRVALVLSI